VAADDLTGLHRSTVAVVAGRGGRAPGAPLNVPVTLSSTFHADGDLTYAREGNPTWTALEETLGALEGGRALVFASGMGAASAVFDEVPVGAAVVAPADAYTGTRGLLRDTHERGRLEVRLVDVADTGAVTAAAAGAALVWVESPTNPLLAIADIPAIAAVTKAAGALLAVDNTFATPLLQQPLALGADIVMHSGTKFIAGHSDVLLGAVVSADADYMERLHQRRTLLGAIPGPMEAFLALRGLRSLPVRLEQSQRTAGVLAQRLLQHPSVGRVRYPGLVSDPGHERAARQMQGFGAIVSFEVADGATAERVCAATGLIVHATSLGGIETTMERRRRHPDEDLTPDGLIRLSVGCEHVDDLWTDLAAALDGATTPSSSEAVGPTTPSSSAAVGPTTPSSSEAVGPER
jgi:cystathionine gamma-synthase